MLLINDRRLRLFYLFGILLTVWIQVLLGNEGMRHAAWEKGQDANAAIKDRPRARDLGIKIGILPPGSLNAITDVAGVMVGQTTIIRGENVRTGVTAVLPHNGNLFRQKVAGAVFVGNGFGKLMGSTQIDELGEIET